MARKSKYAPGTLLQYTPKAMKKHPKDLTANAILVVVDAESMYQGDVDTGHLTILNFYKTQDCFVKPYTGSAIELWTTEIDICVEFSNSDRDECREFCRNNNIDIR